MNGDQDLDSQQVESKISPGNVFMPPSIDNTKVLDGTTYSHFTYLPEVLQKDTNTECVMGVDEAGRGPVLGG
jgi:ribonuclease H2 subunit A